MKTYGEFTCAHCKGVFDKARPDEDAHLEAETNFPGHAIVPDNVETVCDDCYRKFMNWFEGLPPEYRLPPKRNWWRRLEKVFSLGHILPRVRPRR